MSTSFSPSVRLVNPVTEFSTDGTMAANSDSKLCTERAIRTYVTNAVGAIAPPEAGTDGIVDKTQSTIDMPDATTVRIQPAVPGGSYDIIVINGGASMRYTVSAAQQVSLASGTGLYFIYFDSTATLSVATVWNDDFILKYAIVATAFYNAAMVPPTTVLFSEERHGIAMPPVVHLYEHNTYGTRYVSGLALNSFQADQNGNLDSHAQFGGDQGYFYDEDLTFSVAPRAAAAAFGVLLYRIGNAWQGDLLSIFSVKRKPAGLLYYNQYTGGAWQLTELTENDYVLAHVFATNQATGPRWTAVMGQARYTTIPAARAGATSEITSLTTIGLPTAEWVLVGTVIFQTSNGYGNSVKARVRTNDLGESYTNWLVQRVGRGTAPTAHANLSGLSADDHLQYAQTAGRPAESLTVQATLRTDFLAERTGAHGVSVTGVLNDASNRAAVAFPVAPGTSVFIGPDTAPSARADCVCLGYRAGNNLTGGGNIAVGSFAATGAVGSTGINNTVIGFAAGSAIAGGSYHTLVGASSGTGLVAETGVTAVGYQAMLSTTGGQNVAVGYQAIIQGGAVTRCVAVGAGAMGFTVNTLDSTFVGYNSGESAEGDTNSGLGSEAGQAATGSDNVYIGYRAGKLSVGNYCTYIGAGAGFLSPGGLMGTRNTYVGYGVVPLVNETETTRIGAAGAVLPRTFITGIRGVTTGVNDAVAVLIDSAGQLGTVSSALRTKQNIAPMPAAVAGELLALRPRTFEFRSRPGVAAYGLVAEEVAELPLLGAYLTARGADGQLETVRYHELPALLLELAQRQAALIRGLEARVAALEAARQG